MSQFNADEPLHVSIPPPTAGSIDIVLNLDDNMVKVILKNSIEDKLYDLLAGDLQAWEVLQQGVPGTGGDISVDVPITGAMRYFRFSDGE